MKKLFQNGLLIILSLAAGYTGLEYFLFPALLDRVPLKLHFAVKEEIRVLTQSSKDSVVPERYLALFGDSYSQGYGDWLLDADPDANSPYHSAHVLHDLSGRDVITFGKSGSGSLSGLVGHPVRWLDYIRQSRLSSLPDPGEILVYFYEGNDLNDNLEDLKTRYIERNYDPAKVYDPAYFRSFIEKEVVGTSPFKNPDWTDLFFFTDFLQRTLKARDNNKSTLIASENVSPGEGKVNRAIIGGKERPIPDGLQSPALELTSGELHLTVYIFEQALKYMKERFQGIPIHVVYLPSVLSCYEIVSPYVSIQNYQKSRESTYPSYLVHQRGEQIATMIRSIAEQEKLDFIDARPALRALGQKQVFHGPKDWKHYNKDGYTALARAIHGQL